MYILLILKIIGYIVAGLVGLVFLVLILPFSVRVKYINKELKVTAHVLLVPIKVLPMKEKKEKEEKKKKKKKKEKKETEKLGFDKSLIKKLLPAAIKFLKWVSFSIRIRRVKLQIVVQKEDSYLTGITVGRLYSGLVLLKQLLSQIIHIKYKKVMVVPDFGMQYGNRTDLDCKVVVFPCILIVAAIELLLKVIKEMSKTKT